MTQPHIITQPLPTSKGDLLIERPTIFPQHVMAGVTLKNPHLFPQTGLSLLKAQILTPEEVLVHRHVFAEALDVPVESLKFQRQVHGNTVRHITFDSPEEESDAMITHTQGLVLCVGMADCVGVLLYDTVRSALGAVHSGWGGTRHNIIKATIEAMQREFGTHPEHLLAYLAPAASGARYVVREDVAQHFPASVLTPLEHRADGSKQWLFDNRQRITEQLLECGVPANRIECASGCTLDETTADRYHSHRRDGARAGRMVAFIGLM